MTCTGRFAEVADYAIFDCGADASDPIVAARLEMYLDMASSDIHAAMSAAGACNCALADWTTNYLKKLTMVDASVLQQCPCSQMSPDEKEVWLNWLATQLDLIRTGKVELCDGYTGSDVPSFAVAPRSLTEFSAGEIILQTLMKEL